MEEPCAIVLERGAGDLSRLLQSRGMESRTRNAVVAALLAVLFAACASSPRAERPAAEPAVARFAFLEGVWTMQQAKGALIEETWGAPRGKAVLGSFRRVLGNGVTPFYEFTQIVADEAHGALLRQIHVHGDFETDPKRAAPMVLKLERADGRSASFVPLDDAARSNAGSLARVAYTRVDERTLLLVVEPRQDPAAPAQAPLEFRMVLAR